VSDITVVGRGLPSTVVKTDQGNTYSTGAQSLAAASSLLLPTSGGYAPTADGSVGYDSTQDKYVAGGAGALTGSFPRVLSLQFSSSDSIVDDTVGSTETAFVTTFTIPANYLIANKALRVTAVLEMQTGASPPTLQFRLRLGGVSGTLLYSQASTITPTASATRGISLSWIITGTAAPGASVNVETGLLAWVTAGNAVQNATAQPVAVATNAAQAITVTAQWSGNVANTHSVLLRQLLVEELN
jgi:hypothetical protein